MDTTITNQVTLEEEVVDALYIKLNKKNIGVR